MFNPLTFSSYAMTTQTATGALSYSRRDILKITFPVMMSLLMEQLISLTDTAYLGRVGEVELGACALASVYYLVIYMLGFGFSVGAQVMMARRHGAGELRRMGDVFNQGVLFMLLFAAVMCGVSHVVSPWLLAGMIESPAVLQATNDYVFWRAFGFFFSFVALMFRAFFVSTTHTRTLTVNSLVMVGTNVVLNYILIFGKLGFPALGISGAAIASALSEGVSLVFFIIYTLRHVDYRRYGLFARFRLHWPTLRHVMSVSIWVMIQNGVSFIGWFVFFLAMEHQGEHPLAITNVVRSLSSILFMFINAFASTNSSLVANLIGAQRHHEVLPMCWRTIGLCYAFVLPVAALMALLPEWVLRIYTDDLTLVHDAIPSLWVLLSSYLLAVPGFVFFFCVSATGNTSVALRFELASITVYVLYIFYIAVYRRADVALCWTTEHVYDAMLFFTYISLRGGAWRHKPL